MKKEQDCSGRRKKSKSLAAFVLLAHLLAPDEERIAIPCFAGTNISFEDRWSPLQGREFLMQFLKPSWNLFHLSMRIKIRLLQILTLPCYNKFVHWLHQIKQMFDCNWRCFFGSWYIPVISKTKDRTEWKILHKKSKNMPNHNLT